jgi:hypothetical protein
MIYLSTRATHRAAAHELPPQPMLNLFTRPMQIVWPGVRPVRGIVGFARSIEIYESSSAIVIEDEEIIEINLRERVLSALQNVEHFGPRTFIDTDVLEHDFSS